MGREDAEIEVWYRRVCFVKECLWEARARSREVKAKVKLYTMKVYRYMAPGGTSRGRRVISPVVKVADNTNISIRTFPILQAKHRIWPAPVPLIWRIHPTPLTYYVQLIKYSTCPRSTTANLYILDRLCKILRLYHQCEASRQEENLSVLG